MWCAEPAHTMLVSMLLELRASCVKYVLIKMPKEWSFLSQATHCGRPSFAKSMWSVVATSLASNRCFCLCLPALCSLSAASSGKLCPRISHATGCSRASVTGTRMALRWVSWVPASSQNLECTNLVQVATLSGCKRSSCSSFSIKRPASCASTSKGLLMPVWE